MCIRDRLTAVPQRPTVTTVECLTFSACNARVGTRRRLASAFRCRMSYLQQSLFCCFGHVRVKQDRSKTSGAEAIPKCFCNVSELSFRCCIWVLVSSVARLTDENPFSFAVQILSEFHRDVIYTSRAYATMSMSVCLSVYDVCALWSQGAMDPGYLCMLG